MVGPCAWEPPAPEPSWLADMTDPLVVVTTSSEFQDDGRLAQTAMDALADQPLSVVATVPGGRSLGLPYASQCAGGVHPARSAVRQGRGRGDARWDGCHSEGAESWRTGRGGAFRTGPARGRPAGAGGRRRRAVAPPASSRAPTPWGCTGGAMTKRPGAARVAKGYRDTGGPVAAADAVESRLIGVSSGL